MLPTNYVNISSDLFTHTAESVPWFIHEAVYCRAVGLFAALFIARMAKGARRVSGAF